MSDLKTIFVDALAPRDPGWPDFVAWAESRREEVAGLLPEGFGELCELIGVAEILAMLRTFGGAEIVLSRSPAKTNSRAGRLRREVGDLAYAAVLDVFGEGKTVLPTGRSILYRYRDHLIAQRTAGGESAARIGERLGCTRRTVHRARARLAADTDRGAAPRPAPPGAEGAGAAPPAHETRAHERIIRRL